MTTKRTFQSLVAIFSLALILVSCGLAKSSAPRPTDTVGTNPDELKAKLVEIMENAGGTLETAEFASITSSCSYSGKMSYSVYLEIVKPQNKNKLAEATWYSSESSPNNFSVTDIVLSDSKNNVIKEYDQFKDILFLMPTLNTTSPIHLFALKKHWKHPDMVRTVTLNVLTFPGSNTITIN